MPFADRIPLLKELENLRSSKVICYVTSVRQGVNSLISDDAVRQMIEHLALFSNKPNKIDLLIVSNGGDSIVPWRLIPILREYADCIGIIVPFKAYSAATILALGADEIVMHKYGALGPIDPTVTNEFNPIEQGTGRRLGVSVEDVKAYISFIRNTAGINHEEEVVKAIQILATEVHPLALGNVERFISQSRLIATKLLELHTSKEESHKISSVVEALASKLFFHGHPINRREAIQLGLKVLSEVSPEIEETMWKIYLDFEAEMDFRTVFDPISQLHQQPRPTPSPGFHSQIAVVENAIEAAKIESAELSSSYKVRFRHILNADPQLQQSLQAMILDQRWDQQSAP